MLKLSRSGRSVTLLLEILMIVIGINVALWFESWFQDLQDAETEERYLVDLRNDLLTDIDNLDSVIESGEAKSQRVAQFIDLMPTVADLSPEEQAQAIYTPPNYQFFVPSDFTYRSMQESGDFRLLSDDVTKKALLKLARRYREIELLQANFIQALDDSYIPLLIQSFDVARMRLADPALLNDLVFKNFFAFAIKDTQQRILYAEDARTQARSLLDLIETQIR